MAELVNTINSMGIYATRAVNDEDGNSIKNTYAKTANLPVTDVTVDGTSVVSNGTAAITMPTELVPDVTSSDDGKILQATYSGGTGSYSWETAPNGVPSSTSTDEGKVLTVNSSGNPNWAMPAVSAITTITV